jgi:hypothetical protein
MVDERNPLQQGYENAFEILKHTAGVVDNRGASVELRPSTVLFLTTKQEATTAVVQHLVCGGRTACTLLT